MRLYGLIGYPLTHSFSEKYFTKKFEREGLTDCRYKLFPLASITELPGILNMHSELEGLNVTVPYKRPVLSFLDSSNNIPAGINACNCIHIKEGKLIGHNTDITGFEKSFTPLLKPRHNKALVLGNGGAAAAVVFVLKKLAIDFIMVSRELHGDSSLVYKDIDEQVMNDCNIIINTTPLGMYPHLTTCPDIPYRFISQQHLLYDLVYNPSKTLFLQKGEERGASIKNGEEMLVLQAEESWKIWNAK
ncbi:MAG TPA: shikimate dehydrogenase [Chitinophagaceae bacterium]